MCPVSAPEGNEFSQVEQHKPCEGVVSGCFTETWFGSQLHACICSLPAGDKVVNPGLVFCMFPPLCGFISYSYNTGLSELQDVPSFDVVE